LPRGDPTAGQQLLLGRPANSYCWDNMEMEPESVSLATGSMRSSAGSSVLGGRASSKKALAKASLAGVTAAGAKALPELQLPSPFPKYTGRPLVRGALCAREESDAQLGFRSSFGFTVHERMTAADEHRARVQARFADTKLNGELARSEALRFALAEQSGQQLLDLRGLVDSLSHAELHELVQRCTRCVSVNLGGWRAPNSLALRSIGLALGAQLTSVDLSGAPVLDEHLADLCSRFFVMERVDVSRCAELGVGAMKAVADGCCETLTELNLSECHGVDSDGLGWLGGTVGASRGACTSLVALDCGGCARITDAGLRSLGAGCAALQFVSFGECKLIGNVGVSALCGGCPGLRVLNLAHCDRVGDGALRAAAENCHLLKSLNIRGCWRVTDEGLEALAAGCKMLQSLNIASCKSVSEAGVCAVAMATHKTLQLMNLTGCERLTASSLEHLVAGLPFCEQAETFFGFKPRVNALEMKLKVQQRVINDAAALHIQAAYRGFIVRKAWQALLERRLQELAVSQIALAWKAFSRIQRARARLRYQREVLAAVKVQCCMRVYRSRVLLEALRTPVREAIAQGNAVTALQAVIRGAFVRHMRRDVVDVIELLRATRWEEVTHAAATCLQGQWVLHHARKKTEALREYQRQRRRDMALAVVEMQRVVRGHACRGGTRRMRFELMRTVAMEMRAVVEMQKMYRGYHVRLHIDEYREACERARLFREAAAMYLQCFWRQCQSVTRLRRKQAQHRFRCEYATKIQMFWRRMGVPGWKPMRFSRIVQSVRTQYRLDMLEVRRDVLQKEFNRIQSQGRDSASEDDEKEALGLIEPDDEGYNSWEEFFDDEKGRVVWFNAAKQIRRFKPPIGYEYEESLVSLQVKIFWSMEHTWYDGVITKWSKKHKRHRVDYDDGDHEWIDLRDEETRVQILDRDREGEHWVQYQYFEPPLLQKRRHDHQGMHLQCQEEEQEHKLAAAAEKRQQKKDELAQLMRAAEDDRAKAWQKEYSQAEGMFIEVNSITGEARPFLTPEQKEAAERQKRAAAWTQLEDVDSGRFYWFNTFSNETQWDSPYDNPM